MTRIALEGITLLADDVAAMGLFFEDVLGFEVAVRETDYLALANDGVRLAVFRRAGLADHTNGHPSFTSPRGGQAVELNFECDSPAEVATEFDRIIAAGGTEIARPTVQAWGHFTGFFGDPAGNIHSLFAVIPVDERPASGEGATPPA